MFAKMIIASIATTAALAMCGAPAASAAVPSKAASPISHIAAGRAATASRTGHRVGMSYGFSVLNLTSDRLTQTQHNGSFSPIDNDGYQIDPGFSSNFSVIFWYFNNTNDGYVTYQVGSDPNATFTVEGSDLDDTGATQMTISGQSSTFSARYKAYVVPDGSSDKVIVEASGSNVHNLSGNQAQQQYQALKQLGNANSNLHYQFDTTGYQHNVLSGPVLAGAVMNNTTRIDQSESYAASAEVETTESFSATAAVSAGIEGVVQATASATYGQSYAQDHSTTETENITIPAGDAGWFTEQNPVDRVTGNFTITIGGDTWNLQGVTFDIPLPTGGDTNLGPVFTPNTAPLGSPNIPN